jgi:uncharacterized membrane protein (GlpM family)
MDLIIKGLIGGLVIISIGLVSRQVGPLAAGILVWLPVVTFAGVIIIALDGGAPRDLQSYVKGAAMSLPVWVLAALTLYLALERLSVTWAIVLSFAVWLIGATLFLTLASQ